jgi:hypothetical protein
MRPHPLCLVVTLCVQSLLLAPSARAQSVEPLKALPRNCNPGRTLFQGADGFLYGVLRETGLPITEAQWNLQASGIGLPNYNGAVYQLSPSGDLKYLHFFPYIRNGSEPNATGIEPLDLLAMGRDGFLYGITNNGGTYGRGVFYRLSTDGVFEIIAHLKDVAPYFFTSFVQRGDGAFYAYYPDQDSPNARRVFRFSLDGSWGPVGEAQPASWGQLLPDPDSDERIVIAWNDEYDYPPTTKENKVKFRRLEAATGNLVSEHVFAPFTAASDTPLIRGMRGSEIYVYTRSVDWRNNAPGRLAAIDWSGLITNVADFSTADVETNGLPPALLSFHAAGDGTFYFSGGPVTREISVGVGVGSRLFHLLHSGEWSEVCDFDGYPLAALCEGREEVLYGLSLGPSVGQDEPHPPEIRTAARIERAGGGGGNWVPRSRHGTFRLVPAGMSNVNLAPTVRPDKAIIRPTAKGAIVPTHLSILRNDRDPDGDQLTINEITTPKFGTTVIENDSKGFPVVVYTPDAAASRSEVLHYEVDDGNGQTAQGTIKLRGQVAGRYRGGQDQGDSSHSVNIEVSKTGRFSVVAEIAGRKLRASGGLNYDDGGLVSRRLRDGTVWSLRFELENAEGDQKVASYHLAIGEQTVTGTAVR